MSGRLSLEIRVEIRDPQLPGPFIGDGLGVPEEPRLRDHEAGSCRINEGLAHAQVVAFASSLADSNLLEGGDHQWAGGCLEERL